MSANADEDDFMIKIKAWWKSVTVWLAGLLVAISQVPPSIVEMLHPDARDWAYTVIGLALLWDRLFNTNQAITLKAAQKPVAADRVIVK